MDDIGKFIPTDPNFGVFNGAAGTVSFIISVLLALAALAALIAFVFNLVKLAGAAFTGNSVALSRHSKSTGIAFGLLILFTALWGGLVTVITRFGAGIG